MLRIIVECLGVLVITVGGSCQIFASDGFEDLVRVVKSGTDEKSLLGYVNASSVVHTLTVDEILFLSDLGLSAETIKAIGTHGQNQGSEMSIVGAPLTNAEAVLEQAGTESEPSAAENDTPLSEEAPPLGDVVQESFVAPPVITVPPVAEVDYSTFYDGLAPYGNWFDIDGEWCWQPTAVLVDRGWSPYCQGGRWVYSDCGWAWNSTYSWGWAPFHYGRWRHHSHYGWIWRPGREWGPAWVCWRYSNVAIGWAPLPPEVTFDNRAGLCYQGRAVPAGFDFGLGWDAYSFVSIEHFCEPRVSRNRFPRARVEPIFHTASLVQTPVLFQNGRICNFGPPPASIVSVTHQEIRPVTIVDYSLRMGDPIPRPRISGLTLAFYRPLVAPTARENPRQVVVRREVQERERRDAIRHDDIFQFHRSATTVQGEQLRGQESRSIPHPIMAPIVPTPPDTLRREQLRLSQEMASQRQAEEAAARLQEEQRRRASELIQVQKEQRQRDIEQARQQALAEQQHRAAELMSQQEEQRRATEAMRQQEFQRRAQEVNRQQERQREADAAAWVVEQQRQVLRVQREAEENAARWQIEHARNRVNIPEAVPQNETHRPSSETLSGYSEGSVTKTESNRGASSRNYSRHPMGR